jgi:uncharacterized Tic20 family protein
MAIESDWRWRLAFGRNDRRSYCLFRVFCHSVGVLLGRGVFIFEMQCGDNSTTPSPLYDEEAGYGKKAEGVADSLPTFVDLRKEETPTWVDLERAQSKNVGGPADLEDAYVFHFVGIVCAVLSLLCPLIEIIPVVMYLRLREEVSTNKKEHRNLAIIHVIVVVVALSILCCLLSLFVLFTLGIGLIAMIFVIPYVVMYYFLVAALSQREDPAR